MKKILFLFIFIPVICNAQTDSIQSGLYKFTRPVAKINGISSKALYEGKAHDFEWMQLNVNLIHSTDLIKQQVPANEEHLLILKSGIFHIQLGKEVYTLRPGSVAVMMPGEKYAISCEHPGEYFTMKYRGATAKETDPKYEKSFVKVYDSIPYKPNNKGGGRRDYFEQPTVMQKRFEMHVTTLKEGLWSHDPHTHRAEEIIVVINGDTEMLIGDKTYPGKMGDVFFAKSNLLHGIRNAGLVPCMYFAIQFE